MKGGLICYEQSIELKHKWRCWSKDTICADKTSSHLDMKRFEQDILLQNILIFLCFSKKFLGNASQRWIKTYSITSSTLWEGSSFSGAHDQLHQQRCFQLHYLIKPPWLHVQPGLDGPSSSTLFGGGITQSLYSWVTSRCSCRLEGLNFNLNTTSVSIKELFHRGHFNFSCMKSKCAL